MGSRRSFMTLQLDYKACTVKLSFLHQTMKWDGHRSLLEFRPLNWNVVYSISSNGHIVNRRIVPWAGAFASADLARNNVRPPPTSNRSQRHQTHQKMNFPNNPASSHGEERLVEYNFWRSSDHLQQHVHETCHSNFKKGDISW